MAQKNRKFSKLCVAGFALGILGVFISYYMYDSWNWRYFYFLLTLAGITAIVGLILSIRGVRSFRWDSDKGRWLGIAGIVISLLVLCFVLLFFWYMTEMESLPREHPPTTIAHQYDNKG